jgi:hypothetical protein
LIFPVKLLLGVGRNNCSISILKGGNVGKFIEILKKLIKVLENEEEFKMFY